MIARINKVYERTYTDNGQTKVYVEWTGTDGKPGRTEGKRSNSHMQALIQRGHREGVELEIEIW